ncbi:MAG TPA: hypothetical protein PK416_10685 [Thermodesulfobacteriota bacterium]|nr:hypothetical protein [Thermodesulfobacteriota bacterium]
MPLAGLLVPLAGEMIKFLIIEQNMRQMAAKAGATAEQLEEALVKLRAEFAALDPTKLPEV